MNRVLTVLGHKRVSKVITVDQRSAKIDQGGNRILFLILEEIVGNQHSVCGAGQQLTADLRMFPHSGHIVIVRVFEGLDQLHRIQVKKMDFALAASHHDIIYFRQRKKF